MKTLTIFTDGSSTVFKDKKNLRYGGIGVFFDNDCKNNISEYYCGSNVTNQRMELLACIKGIKKCVQIMKDTGIDWNIQIYSDSMYTIKCITEWGPRWILWGWRRKQRNKLTDNIKNLDLIKKLYKLSRLYPVQYQHVRSHRKEPSKTNIKKWQEWYGNKHADLLASKAMLLVKERSKKCEEII